MATIHRWLIAAVVAGGWILELASCSELSGPEQAASTRRMAERLEEIARNADPSLHIYVNAERVEYFRSQVEHLRATTAANDPQGKDLLLKTRFTLANELLRAGQFEEAVKNFRQLQAETVGKPQVQHILQVLLGLSYLRLGEQENCIVHHNIESCLLPIRGAGVHQIKRGSRAAIEEFLGVLQRNPGDLSARWLLNIAYMTLGEHPDKVPQDYLMAAEVFASDYDIKRFRDVAPQLGLDVVGLSGGAIMEDFDGDGYLDIVASSWGLRDQIRYFHNRGDGTFADNTQEAGLVGIVGGLNTRLTDYDNNGYADILVLRGAWLGPLGHYPNSLLHNQGDGTFIDATEKAGLLTLHPTQTATWGDFDNDGWVDLFVGNESIGTEIHPCELFRNKRDGTFADVAREVGVAVVGYVKGVAWGDYNNDGRLDLYIARIAQKEANLLYRNEGENVSDHWHFVDVSAEAGVPGPTHSFPTWFWDYDNDGWQDIFVAGFKAQVGDVAADYLGLPHEGEHPRLYRNKGDGTFADVTREIRLDKPLLAMGCNFGDLDNDGYLDAYIGTGDPGLASLMPNRMFRNVAGQFFQDVTTSGGFGHLQKGHGVAFGDIDHDGDQDVFAVMGGAFTGDVAPNILFENPGHGNHWIKLRLEGVRSNRAAIGARIKVSLNTKNGARDVYATVTSGSSFGASSLRQEIGLGQATSISAIEIVWPAGEDVQVFQDVEMDQFLHIREGDPTPLVLEFDSFDLSPENRAEVRDHVHHEQN